MTRFKMDVYNILEKNAMPQYMSAIRTLIKQKRQFVCRFYCKENVIVIKYLLTPNQDVEFI